MKDDGTDILPITDDVQGHVPGSWIIGSALGVGSGNAAYPASVQGPIAIHTDTGLRCAR